MKIVIKGVNRRVIEINNPDGEYFEKAILFVKPEKSGDKPETLRIAARKYLSELDENDKRRRLRLLIIISSVVVAFITVILTVIIF
ncbi:MAG: hypothetical protein IKK32_04115 [Oscillospiraceae bacterium]|nr:hypothetical protein [Oscillospiraceae bacterium]